MSYYSSYFQFDKQNSKSDKKPTVPVIEDLANINKAIQDSWGIALYLEEVYPDTPSLFHGNVGVHKFSLTIALIICLSSLSIWSFFMLLTIQAQKK